MSGGENKNNLQPSINYANEDGEFDIWENDLSTGRFIHKSNRIFAALGYTSEEIAPDIDSIWDFIHPDDIPNIQRLLNELLSGVTDQYHCEFRLRAKNGDWIWYANHNKVLDRDATQLGSRFVGVTLDIHEKRNRDKEKTVLLRTHKLLNACTNALMEAHTEQELLDSICTLTTTIGGYKMAWVGYAQHDANKSVVIQSHYGIDLEYCQQGQITWSDTPTGQGPIGSAIRTNSTIVYQDYLNNPRVTLWRDWATASGFGSSIGLPLNVNNQVIGAISAYADEDFAFSKPEVELLEELAKILSYGIETLRTRLQNTQAQVALMNENEKNLALLHNASDGIHILDEQGNVIEVSDSFCEMLGYTRAEMIGMNVSHWEGQLSQKELDDNLNYQLSQKKRVLFETVHLRKDGTIFNVEVSGFPLQLNGKPVLFNSSRDISARKKIEDNLHKKQRQLIANEKKFRELLSNLNIAIIVHNPDTSITYSNPRASELLGLTPDQLQGRVAFDPAWCFINEQGSVVSIEEYPVNKVLSTMTPIESHVLGVITTNANDIVWLSINAFPEFDDEGTLRQIIVHFDDITARKQADEQIHHLAFFDDLTGLPNRRLLMDRLNSALATSARNKKYGAVLFIDLDRFKTINDVLGHDFGDLLLKEVAKRIQACVRRVDTVARLGGDEFVVVLLDLDEQTLVATQKTAMIADKIRQSLSSTYKIKGNEQHSSPSIGVSMFYDNQDSAESLLRQADMAMYKAKDSGRNAFRFFNPEMQSAVETRALLEADLRYAIPDNQLCLMYQIQVDNQHNPLGAEVLIRWVHPKRGLVSPMQFIPIAEESSLILDIGGWVIKEACRQLAHWAKFEMTEKLTIAVNVSAQQFRQIDFVDVVLRTLNIYQVKPERLKLELTESVVLNDVNDVVNKMHALKEIGVQLSMDDFGTGYSSLSYLKQLPLDQIKIDQSFVRDITSDPNDAVMVKTIIDLAKNFHLNVIAEGVENEEQLNFLKSHGCEAYQGYLFSRPIYIDQFEELLSAASAPQLFE